MIAVIADDLTGAAEMGGVGLHHGLNAEVQTNRYQKPQRDVAVFDTDSRSTTQDRARAASRRVAAIAGEAAFIYKKVDSAMRGHILAELEVLLGRLGRDRALLIPANPTLGRTIVGGEYFVRGVRIHETDFSRDPEYPATTSRVLDLLDSSESFDVIVLDSPRPVPEGTIAIGEVGDWSDLLKWARHVRPDILVAGGSDFFAAILQARGCAEVSGPRPVQPPRAESTLFVCGSSSDYSRRAVRRAENRGLQIAWMPGEILRGDRKKHLKAWVEITSGHLNERSLAIAAIGQLPVGLGPALPHRLRENTAALVRKVLQKHPVRQLYIEGGATSSSIVRAMGWERFLPVEELSRGVVRMQVEGERSLYMTIKPGSYPWPKGVTLHDSLDN